MSTTELPAPVTADPTPRRLSAFGLRLDLRAIGVVLLVFASTRLLLLLLIFLSSAAIPMNAGQYGYASPDNIVLDGLVRHDSWWYVNIVEQGYTLGDVKTGVQGTVTFFPLYPLLVKLVAGLLGNIFVAGVLVSNVAFLVALLFLYGLVQLDFDDATAGRAVFYLAAAPTTIFCMALYTESLFLALVCATFYFARRQRWTGAACAGALAAATRNTGVLLAVVIGLEALHAAGLRFRPRPLLGATPGATLGGWWLHLRRQIAIALAAWPGLLAAAYVPIGLLIYMIFLGATFGDPLAFIHAQATWGRGTSPSGITRLLSNIVTNLQLGPHPLMGQLNTLTVLNVLSTIGFLPLVVMVIARLRPAYAVYSGLTILVPLSTGTVGSMTRYVLMLVPCFVLLAIWGRRPAVDRLVMAVFLPLAGYCAVLFSHWYFIG